MFSLSELVGGARVCRSLLGYCVRAITLGPLTMTPSPTNFTSDSTTSQRVTALLAQLHGVEPGARERAVLLLQSLEPAPVIGVLTGLLDSPNPDLRCDAAEALLRLDPEQTIDLVLPLLNDPISTVRWYTGGLLHDFGDSRAIPPLLNLLDDPDADVRHVAAYALGAIGHPSALPALCRAAQLDHATDQLGYRVSDAATEAIQNIQDRHRQQ